MVKNYLKDDFYSYLKINNYLFDKIITSNKKFFFVWDCDNREHIWISSTIWKKLGFKDENEEDNLKKWVSIFKLLETPRINFDEAIKQKSSEIEVEFKNIKGEKIRTTISLFSIKDTSEKVIRLIGVLDNNWNNLSLNYSINQFEILIDLYKSSYNTFPTIDDLYQRITKALAEGLGVTRSSLWFFEGNKLICKSLYNLELQLYQNQTVLSKEDMNSYFNALQQGIAIVAEDAQSNIHTKELNKSYLIPNKIKSILDIPVRDNGELVGTLCCENVEKIRKWSENDISFARSITDIYSLFVEEIQRREVEKKLAETYNRFDFISENITDGIYIIEMGNLVYTSKRYLEMCGYTFEHKLEEHNKDMYHLVHPDDLESIKKKIWDSVSLKLPSVKYVFRCKKNSGEYYWREDIMNLQYNENGYGYRVVTIARDITQEKIAEFEAIKKNAAIELQNVLLIKLYAETTNLSIENKIDTVIKIAAEGLQIDRASYWKIVDKKLICKNLYDTILHNEVDITLNMYDLPIYFNAITTQPELIADNVLKSKYTSELVDSYFKPLNINGLLDIPVRDNKKVQSILCCEHREKDKNWTENDITFARSLADFLSLTLEEDKRAKLEISLLENIEKLKFISENTSDGIVVFENSKITYVSPAYCKQSGYSEGYLKSISIEDVFEKIYPEDAEKIYSIIFNNLQKKNANFSYEYRFKVKEGEYCWREDSANVIYDKNGNYSKYILISRDISKRKEIESEKESLFKITEKQNEKLTSFTHIISHDIRSHASNMSMILELFEDSKEELEKKDYITMLKESTHKLSETIHFLNESVAMHYGVNNFQQELNLFEVVEKSILGINAIIKTNHVTIDITIDKNCYIKATQSYLESIIFNLITNAIKYKHPDRKPSIEIKSVQNKNEILLTVSDNGIGIDLDKYGDKIFRMYKTFHGNSDAVGLGLFMVKNQIESMKGRVEVESKLDVGTIFKLYLPCQK